MTNYARIKNDIAVDVSVDPENNFHPSIAVEFIEVPEYVKVGWKQIPATNTWSEPPAPTPCESAVQYPVLSPLDFKMCLTVQERLGGKVLSESDPIVGDFYSILEDPRLTKVDINLQSVRDAVAYLFGQLVADGTVVEADKNNRITDVLSGKRI